VLVTPDADTSTPEERDTPDEVSAAGWEEYFGSDRRTGGGEGQSSSSDEFPSYEQTVAKAASLEDHLLWQLSMSGLSERNKAIGRLLIGNLDDDGYLRTPMPEIISGTDFSEAEAESVLHDIQTFDPTGVGARDLPECLMLQLGHLGKSPMGSLGARPGALKGSIVEAVVLPDGTVGDVQIVRSLDNVFGLDQEAIKAAKQWKFMPGTRFGQPVPVLVTIELSFTLR